MWEDVSVEGGVLLVFPGREEQLHQLLCVLHDHSHDELKYTRLTWEKGTADADNTGDAELSSLYTLLGHPSPRWVV